MRKNLLAFLLIIVISMTQAAAPDIAAAVISSEKVLLDSRKVALNTDNINGNNRFEMRNSGNARHFGATKRNAAKITSKNYAKNEIDELIKEVGRLRRDLYELGEELVDLGMDSSILNDFYELDEDLGSLIPLFEELAAMGYVPTHSGEFDEFWEMIDIVDNAIDEIREELFAAGLTPGSSQFAKQNLPSRSASAPSSSVNEQSVSERILALRGDYPEGMRWTNADYYDWSAGIYNRGYGCVAFAFLASDAAFGKDAPARKHTDFSNIRAGDILRLDNDSHSVVVLRVKGSEITLAEGNYNSSIHWGRVITMQQLKDRGNYVITRYQ